MPGFRSLVLIAIAALAGALSPATATAAPKRGKQKTAKRAVVLPAYPKAFQKRHHAGPKSDPDKDGLSSYYEYLAKTNPRRADSDRDGVKDAREDGDADGLRNRTEQRVGSNPRQNDSDHNGRRDGREDRDRDGLANLDEQRAGLDPRDADSDDDDIRDGDEYVGRIVSVDDDAGIVKLWLAGERQTVKATIGEDLAVVCVAPDEEDDAYSHEDDGDYSGDEGTDEGDATDVEESDADEDTGDDSEEYADEEDDGEFADDESSSDEEATECEGQLSAGQWFTNAEFSEGDDGSLTLDLVELVED